MVHFSSATYSLEDVSDGDGTSNNVVVCRKSWETNYQFSKNGAHW